MSGLNDAPVFRVLAVPAVCALIAFLGYYSQYMFRMPSLEPGPPSRKNTVLFNAMLALLWYTYFKSVTEDPGRFIFNGKADQTTQSWCNKCVAPQPPRAHHCRQCGRCIPKMDHHCPWTANCVSLITFPHFIRFLTFANLSLWMLGHALWQRWHFLWEARHLPAYLGPDLRALISLASTSIICFFTSLALGVMLVSTVKSWMFNCTMIESWEIERHEANSDQSGRDWCDATDTNGETMRFDRVFFPYDIGIFANMSQAMGTANAVMWLWPFSSGPKLDKSGKGVGWRWEENGFNDTEGMWPPMNPERLRKKNRPWLLAQRDFAAELRDVERTPEERISAFRKRQAQDTQRRLKLSRKVEEVEFEDYNKGSFEDRDVWTNTNGERLEDFGVDSDAMGYSGSRTSDENLPLAEVLRRRTMPRKPEI